MTFFDKVKDAAGKAGDAIGDAAHDFADKAGTGPKLLRTSDAKDAIAEKAGDAGEAIADQGRRHQRRHCRQSGRSEGCRRRQGEEVKKAADKK